MTTHNDYAEPADKGAQFVEMYENDLVPLDMSNVEVGEHEQAAKNGDSKDGRMVLTEHQIKFIAKMSEIGMPVTEITSILGLCKSHQTLVNRYGDILEQGKARGNYMLRRRQYDIAMEGDTKMLIHLGKSRLGQNETTEIITKNVLPWGNDTQDNEE